MARVVILALLLVANIVLLVVLTNVGSPPTRAAGQAETAPAPPYLVTEPPVALVIGDSFAEGVLGVTTPKGGFAQQTAGAMKWTLLLDAEPRTGYVSGEPSSEFPRRRPYPARLAEHDAGEQVSYVLVTGGNADRDATAAQLRTEVRATLRRARQTWPTARVIAVAPFWCRAEVPAYLQRVRDVVGQEARDQDVDFVDPIGGRWTTPANESWMAAGEAIHPSQRGHDYIAKRLVADLIELGVPVGETVNRGTWFRDGAPGAP